MNFQRARHKALNHVAGVLGEDGVQRCVICGHILSDYRNSVSPDPDFRATGFAVGPVYQDGNMTSVGRDEALPDCTPE